ncbi:MAG: GTP-binding protein [Candidatus Lokiarchaeota archaeon]|nr:GTP-binding protein [Candidatus Lokiarchaeota archaeon]
MMHMSGDNSHTKVKKIVLLGLDNAGKSSILLSLTSDTNLMSYYSLKPTLGIETEEINEENKVFKIWEFGGQKQFRKDYLDKLDKYLMGTDKIIYVIDIQDINRYDIALEYLKSIGDFLLENELKIDFTIFLHKFDPRLESKDDFKDSVIQSKIIDKIKEIFSKNYSIKIFKTTIYTIFEKKIFSIL